MKRFVETLVFILALAGFQHLSVAAQVTSGSTDECINVPWHGAPTPGTPVHVKQCDPHPNQQWTIAAGQITGIAGLCLDIQGGQPQDGARVIYATCHGSPSQNWRLSNGQILGLAGKCLDIRGGAPSNGAMLMIATCSNAPSQQWTVH